MPRRGGRRGGGGRRGDLPPWVMLDRFAHCTLLGPREETVGDGTLSEVSDTCTASGNPGKRPYLRRLPPCFKGGQVDPELDKLFHPYRFQQQRPMSSNDIGLLCHGDKEFTVAKLSPWGEICLLQYAPDKAMEWDVMRLQMPRGEGIPNFLSGSWNTDVVIPCGDSLCWVDCYLGLLFVSVHGNLRKQQPRFVALPADLDPRRLYIDPGSPDPARRVCLTDSGMIKLIAITDLAGRSLDVYSSNFRIRTWKLINGKWKEDASMDARDLKHVLASDKRLAVLPLPPEFPTINLVDHDIVCFVLNNGKRICWLVEVNLKKKVLGVVTLYINEEKEDQAAAAAEEDELLTFYDIVRKTSPPIPFVCACFIPSQFTMYLSKHDTKSLDFRKMLEKAEVRRGIKNGWINHGQSNLDFRKMLEKAEVRRGIKNGWINHGQSNLDFRKMLEKAKVRRGIKNGWINHGQARDIQEIFSCLLHTSRPPVPVLVLLLLLLVYYYYHLLG